MRYRTLGRVGEVSALGFGAMRLPVADGALGENGPYVTALLV